LIKQIAAGSTGYIAGIQIKAESLWQRNQSSRESNRSQSARINAQRRGSVVHYARKVSNGAGVVAAQAGKIGVCAQSDFSIAI